MKVFNKKNKKRDLEIVFLERPNSIHAEGYRQIPLNLEYSDIDNQTKLIHITSAVPGENKTTTAINLSLAYVELGYKVLLMDLDLHQPKVHLYFNVHNGAGLSNYLIDKIEYKDLIIHDQNGVDIITSGPLTPSPHLILRSEKFDELLNRLKEVYDYIIVDSPPVLPLTDSVIIGNKTDTTLLVVNSKLSSKKEVLQTIKILERNSINIGGIIITNKAVNKAALYSDYGYYDYK